MAVTRGDFLPDTVKFFSGVAFSWKICKEFSFMQNLNLEGIRCIASDQSNQISSTFVGFGFHNYGNCKKPFDLINKCIATFKAFTT